MVYPSPPADDGVRCRFCGAVHAQPDNNKWGMCCTCVANFSGRIDGELTDDIVLLKLAKRLETRAKASANGKQIGIRCEAFALNGYQCGQDAQTKKDGRHVCALHKIDARDTDKRYHINAYVNAKSTRVYTPFAALIIDLCNSDDRLRSDVLRGINAA